MNIPKIPPVEGQIIPPEHSVLDEANKRSSRSAGLAFALLSAALFSVKPVLIKIVYSYGVDTWTVMLLRLVFAFPFIFLVAWHAFYQRREQGLTTDLRWQVLAGAGALGLMFNYGAAYLDMLGLHYITAQFERLIVFTYPTLVALIMFALFKKPISSTVLAALVLCYLGLAIIFGHDLNTLGNDVLTGSGLVFISATIFAFYFVLSKDIIDRVGSRIFTFLTIAAATVAVSIHFSLVNETASLVQPIKVYGLLLLISLTGTVLPLLLLAEAVARIGPSRTSIAGGVGPIFTSISAVLILGEAFTIYHGLGSALIIAGVIMIARR